ncbi:hypothetical protein GCM10007190_14190 [Macrococcus hajekii]|nr:LytTR family DNA-binding domain-containing protein [Macrococcus hajekii]GGB07327.1 hypothetical protein GCM10007190_14190 [Macrococcus hajekii]
MTLIETVKTLEASRQLGIVSSKEERQLLLDWYQANGRWTESFSEPFHERLTVKENIKFYIKWFQSDFNVNDLLHLFNLNAIQRERTKHIQYDDYVLMKLCIAYIQPCKQLVFNDILYNLHFETINQIRQLMTIFEETDHHIVHLLTHIDHAILLTDEVYQVKNEAIKRLEVEQNEKEKENTSQDMQVLNVFKLAVKTEDKTLFLNPEDIDFIEGFEGKVNIHLNNESWLADYSLTELEERLSPYGFYRCHRSYIVNLQKVKEMITWSKNSYSIKLDSSNQNFVPLSRAKLKEFQTYFNGSTVPFTEN